MKLWSISTTVRSPERLRNFLCVLQLLEGEPFDKENQTRYQILLIQHKYYRPNIIPPEFSKYYKDPDLSMPYEVAERIFNYQKYIDPSMRGRQSVNPLNKLGFSVAREKRGKILITELGKKFLQDEYDVGYIFFKSLLKLQFPNPWSGDFQAKDGFDIQPFIATMHLINKVNENDQNSGGLSQTEFCLFIPSLISYKLIDDYVEKIFEYRKVKDKSQFITNFAKSFYQTDQLSPKHISNFYEYGDNIMRYFRLTRYFKVETDPFGRNWRINLEPIRQVEIQQLLKNFSGKSLYFNNIDEYILYISDISLPTLPFENVDNLVEIARKLKEDILQFVKENNLHLTEQEQNKLSVNISTLSKNELTDFISDIREINVSLKEQRAKSLILNNVEKIQDITKNLKDYKTIKKFVAEQFEKIITDALRIINDEIKIKPNYPVDDDGEPISHAPGNQADIECYYKNYNLICEVTLDISNFQWIRETQPVMRHLRDFEIKSSTVKNYCLFISPKIHIDTIYHFWTSIRYGYDGSPQHIIPLTTEQFATLLEVLVELLRKGRRFSHEEVELLYREIILKANSVTGHTEWFHSIPQVVQEWKAKIIA